jgi:DNA-binding PadR family transcriptional regulator
MKPIVFHILLVLMDGERHGYEIVKEVEQRTDDAIRIEPANLYRTLRTMATQELIEEVTRPSEDDSGDGRRRYFAVTDYGIQMAGEEAARLESLVSAARSHKLLGGRRS